MEKVRKKHNLYKKYGYAFIFYNKNVIKGVRLYRLLSLSICSPYITV